MATKLSIALGLTLTLILAVAATGTPPAAPSPPANAPAPAPPVAAAPTASGPKNDFNAGAKSACTPELKKFCSEVTPGNGRVAACLKAHDDKLSPGCSTEWQNARERAHANAKQEIKSFAQACSADAEKFCKDSAGFEEISGCLSKHQTELSKGCSNFRLGLKERTNPTPRSTG